MLRKVLLVAAAGMASAAKLPTVTAHGMGDSCFNAGMIQITQLISNQTGSYAVCVPTGDNKIQDTERGFLFAMDASVDVFAKKIRADPKLAGGFNAAGFSQGNSLIRGYIQKYNDPPVSTFLSVHGTVMGVAGFPHCNPKHVVAEVAQKDKVSKEEGILAPFCDMVDELLGLAAYFKTTQDILFQAGFFRDPLRVHSAEYKANSEIAQWNGEGNSFNATHKANFISVKRYAMIKALKDTMVYPNEGEWWGTFAPGGFKTVLTMNETDMYKRDLFGLKTVNEAGKILFNTTAGNHLKFTEEELLWWVGHYFLE